MLQGYFLARDHFYICEDAFGPMQTELIHSILNRLSHTIYWRSPISILGTSGYEIYIFLE